MEQKERCVNLCHLPHSNSYSLNTLGICSLYAVNSFLVAFILCIQTLVSRITNLTHKLSSRREMNACTLPLTSLLAPLENFDVVL